MMYNLRRAKIRHGVMRKIVQGLGARRLKVSGNSGKTAEHWLYRQQIITPITILPLPPLNAQESIDKRKWGIVATCLLLLLAIGAWWWLHNPASSQQAPVVASEPQKAQPSNIATPTTPNSMPPPPLISQSGKQALIAKDGTPLRIELVPGKPETAVDLQAWTDDSAPNADGHYNWRCKITPAAGGLVERVEATNYEAPADGYQRAFEFSMDQNLPGDQWNFTMAKSFFVHFEDDTYGLLQVQLVAAGTHFATVRSSVNPVAGSRHLEPPPTPATKRR